VVEVTVLLGKYRRVTALSVTDFTILPSKCQLRDVLFHKKLKPQTGDNFLKTECGYVLTNDNIIIDRRMNDKKWH
jgi:hypothetical protein